MILKVSRNDMELICNNHAAVLHYTTNITLPRKTFIIDKQVYKKKSDCKPVGKANKI